MAPQQPERSDRSEPAEGHAPATGEGTGEGAGDGAAPENGEDAPGSGEIRAAERSAERAAEVAVAEGFHTLRIRPYVTETGGEPAVWPLIGAGVPATAVLGPLPAAYAGLEYPQEDEAGAAAARGRHRRRRRGIVGAAAAVAASALAAGTVTVTGHMMGGESGGTDMALPDRSMSMPDVTLPADAAPATGKTAPPVTREATRTAPAAPEAVPGGSSTAPTATAGAQAPVRADPSGPARPRIPGTGGGNGTGTGRGPGTGTMPTPPPTGGGTGPTPPPGPPTTTPTPPTPPPTTAPTPPPPVTVGLGLQLGDTGAAVADLQRRLAATWAYLGHVDGTFDQGVQRAVSMFQFWHGVKGDPSGVYGPNTRKALERATPWA